MFRVISSLVLATILAMPAAAQTSTRVPIPSGDGKAPPPIGSVPPSLVVEPVAMMIAAFDGDGDGKVTRAELAKGVAASFAAFDLAKTGSIGYIAFADWAERWLGDRNALPSPYETDANNDDRITLAELETKFEAIFTRLDRDKDGVLTRAELLTIRADLNRGPGRRGERPAP